MSVYNSEESLEKAIQSVINQTFSDFEFIIINDGSTDNSMNIILRFSSRDSRIKVISNKINLGLTKSLNKGIKIAKAQYIARQDADDISLSHRLEKQVKFLDKNTEYALCGCNAINKKNKKLDLVKNFNYKEIRANLISENCFTHPSVVIRKKVFKKYGFYNENFLYSQDYELWCRLIYKYRLKARNLYDKLILLETSDKRFIKKDINKFLTQRVNTIRIQLKYLKFSHYKLKGIFSIFIRILEILSLSHVLGFFSNFIKKLKI